jgi:hypothetical protein
LGSCAVKPHLPETAAKKEGPKGLGLTKTSGPRLDGGAEEIRTPDPHNAIVVLYQLSYDPIQKRRTK